MSFQTVFLIVATLAAWEAGKWVYKGAQVQSSGTWGKSSSWYDRERLMELRGPRRRGVQAEDEGMTVKDPQGVDDAIRLILTQIQGIRDQALKAGIERLKIRRALIIVLMLEAENLMDEGETKGEITRFDVQVTGELQRWIDKKRAEQAKQPLGAWWI